MKEDEKIIRLAKPVKNGMLHMLFSRFPVILLLLAMQFVLLLVFYVWLSELTGYATAVQTVFIIISVIYLFNNDMDSSAKLTWMFLIAVMPLPAAVMLGFTQLNIGHRKLKKRVEENVEKTRNALRQPEGVLESVEAEGDGTEDLAAFINTTGCFPVYDDSEASYFSCGEEMFEALLTELQSAEKFIYMEYFIIQEGYMWGRILEILSEKAAAGVDVRVLYDGMCEMFQIPAGYWKLLEKKGIKAAPFAPIMPAFSSHYNYRDHRKITVVDGRTAFTGGVNLADEYINRTSRFGYWKDAAVMLKGRAAESFTLMFVQQWNSSVKEPMDLPDFRELNEPPHPLDMLPSAGPNEGYTLPYCDSPLDGCKVGESVYIDILYRATSYVHIMTPYLILDGELMTAIEYAARRGVDVKIILPGIPDKKAAYALAKSHYKALTAAGVKIYEYTPGFVHSKVFVSDGIKAVVGTINLDYRSLYHHFECAAYMFKTACVADIERDFSETLKACAPVSAESIAREKLSYRVMGFIMKFFAPLM